MKAGRLVKAKQFLAAADAIEIVIDYQDIADAYVTMCVHAGIAAADVICCAKLGFHSEGQDHGAAVVLLAKVDTASANQLRTLLGMKTRSGYSAILTAAQDKKRAGRAATALVEAATKVLGQR